MMDPDLLRPRGAPVVAADPQRLTKVLPADTGPLVRTTWVCPVCEMQRDGGPPDTCGWDNPDCPIR